MSYSLIDEIVDRGVLDEDATRRLCEILSPDGNGSPPDIPVFFYLVDRPLVADALHSGTAPEPLNEAVAHAMRALMPMVGGAIGAPMPAQIKRLRRRYRSEEKKYTMVRERLADKTREGREKIFAAYLDTSPAPIFAESMGAEFPDLRRAGEMLRRTRKDLLSSDERLLELLEFQRDFDEETTRELHRRLTNIIEELDDPERVVRTVLSDPKASEHLVAGALAARLSIIDMANPLVALVVTGSPHAPQFAAFAGLLEPTLTRQGLSKFIVDALLDETPDKERLIDEKDLRRAVVAARTVLPRIGSPVEDVEEQINTAAAETARVVLRTWQAFV